MKKIAILIPVFNKLQYTRKCLDDLNSIFLNDSLLRSIFITIVIDDGSKDGTYEWISNNHKHVVLLKGNGNLWWSGGINVGAKYAITKLECSHVLLWNNDIEVDAEYFKTIAKLLERYDERTLIGSKIYSTPQKTIIWSMGGIFNPRRGDHKMIGFNEKDEEKYNSPVEADWLTGMGTLVPSYVINKIGYWDEINFPQYFGDAEFTYRAKISGFKNIVIPELVIWNDVDNTGLMHGGSLKTIVKMLTDKRSLYNFKVNVKFYQLYATSVFAYLYLVKNYLRFFGGFLKWNFLGLFGIKKVK